MYTGLYRLVSFSQVKTTYFFTAISQELLLHQLPLTVLVLYNNKMMKAPKSSFDRTMEAFCYLNVIQLICEMFYFKYYLSKGINLD